MLAVYIDEFKKTILSNDTGKNGSRSDCKYCSEATVCEDHIENFQRQTSSPSLVLFLRRFWGYGVARSYLTTEELA